MLPLDKSILLIFAYLSLVHFNYCRTQVAAQQSQNAANSGSDATSTVFKCLGRLVDTGERKVDVPGAFMNDGVQQSFGLVRKELNCKKGRFKVLLQPPSSQEDRSSGKAVNSIATAKVLKTDPKSWKTNVYEDPSIRIMRNSGYLHIGNDFFHPTEYCFDQIDTTELSLFVCFPECYSQRPCVTKCCAQDEVWDVWNGRCRRFDAISVKNTTVVGDNETLDGSNERSDDGNSSSSAVGVARTWVPYLFSRSVDNCVKKVTNFHRDQISIHYQEHLPSCDPSEYVLVPLRKIHNHAFQRFRVLWTGGVIVRDKNGNWSEFTHGKYCVDGMANFNKHSGGVYTGAFEDQVIIACRDDLSPPILKKPIPLKYAMMLVVAAAILFITALISCLLWDKQNVYEWTVSCEVISMFFLIMFVGIAHTIARRPEKSDFGSAHCVFVGAASHFFWLSTFCWLFIINFEIWWNFRSLVQLRQSRKWFRFSIYQLVGWGMPLLVVGLGLLLDKRWGLQNEELDCSDVTPPNYGQLNCYVSKKAQGPYIFYPIGVILIFNLLFYLLTVCKMWSYQKKSSSIITYRSRSQTQPIIIFAKLFIVMGVSWVFELIAWAITPSEVDKIPLYWVIFDIVTLFQAVSIFVIFIWKKEVLSRLWWKYPRGKVLLSLFLKLPGCSLIPSDRERATSLHHHMQQQVNKIPRENGVRTAGNLPPPQQQQPGNNGSVIVESPLSDQMAFSAI